MVLVGSLIVSSIRRLSLCVPNSATEYCCAGIFKQIMGARNRVGIGLSYRPARLHSLAELVPWNLYLGLLKSLKIRAPIHRKQPAYGALLSSHPHMHIFSAQSDKGTFNTNRFLECLLFIIFILRNRTNKGGHPNIDGKQLTNSRPLVKQTEG